MQGFSQGKRMFHMNCAIDLIGVAHDKKESQYDGNAPAAGYAHNNKEDSDKQLDNSEVLNAQKIRGPIDNYF